MRRTSLCTPVYTLTWLLSCVHFLMFGLETQASQPLKTGDNICPPSLSVLPGVMVRPRSTLRLSIFFSIPHSSTFFFFTPTSFTPTPPSPPLPTPPHLTSPHLVSLSEAKQSQAIQDAAAPFFLTTSCLYSFYFQRIFLPLHSPFEFMLYFSVIIYLGLIAFAHDKYTFFVCFMMRICLNLPPLIP